MQYTMKKWRTKRLKRNINQNHLKIRKSLHQLIAYHKTNQLI